MQGWLDRQVDRLYPRLGFVYAGAGCLLGLGYIVGALQYALKAEWWEAMQGLGMATGIMAVYGWLAHSHRRQMRSLAAVAVPAETRDTAKWPSWHTVIVVERDDGGLGLRFVQNGFVMPLEPGDTLMLVETGLIEGEDG